MAWLAVPLAFLVAARGDTRDSAMYVYIFATTRRFPADPVAYYADTWVEWAYGIAAWLFNSLGIGPRTLFFLISLLTFACLAKAARNLRLSFYELMPYYLGTFFLSQQFMQIRQGLAVAFAFAMITGWAAGSRAGPLRRALSMALAFSIHMVSVVPMATALLAQRWSPTPRTGRIVLWTLAVAAASFAVAQEVSSLEVVSLFDRLSRYAADAEYGSSRGLFDPANVRAALLLALFALGTRSRSLRESKPYVVLLGLYAVHLGLRIGFLDVQILSGRLATALGFAEVLLMPLLVRATISSPAARTGVAAAFLAVHAVATLMVQVPYLVDDYFTPLYIDRAAP